MGTLGRFLQEAREARGIDLRDAAQQTRISINYLKALENEDFAKLPGEVFVKGFLKNYGRFLNLDDAELMKRYADLKPKPQPQPQTQLQPSTPSSGMARVEKTVQPAESTGRKETPIEPFVWGAVIFVSLLVFLFTSLPSRHAKTPQQAAPSLPSSAASLDTAPTQTAQPDKLYLEVAALEDTWLLVRTDASPQKKAVLKRGENLIWSADERFLLSYGRVGSVKLLLNGEELVVKGTKETAVRDLVITRAGIVNQPAPPRVPQAAKPKSKPAEPAEPQAQPQQQQPRVSTGPAAVVPAQPATPPVAAPAAPAPAAPPVPAQ